MPAVITTDLRLNQPRYLKLPNIMKAKKMPIEKLVASDLVAELRDRLQVLGLSEPSRRSSCTRVQSVAELVDKLKNEARVI